MLHQEKPQSNRLWFFLSKTEGLGMASIRIANCMALPVGRMASRLAVYPLPPSVLIPFRLRRIPYGTPCRFHTMLRIDLVRKSRLKQGYRLAFYKPKSTRLFVAVARPNPLCSTKNEDGIYEKYDADTGEGKGCPCFSRSSAFIMEFILDFL